MTWLNPSARAFALGIAILTTVLRSSVLVFSKGVSARVVLLMLVPTWGMTAVLLLLLVGRPSRARRITAVVVYCVIMGGVLTLALRNQFAS